MRLPQKTFESLLKLVALGWCVGVGYMIYLFFVPSAVPQWAQAAYQSLDSMLRPYESQIKGVGVVGIIWLFLYEFWTLQQNVATIRRELAELNEKLKKT